MIKFRLSQKGFKMEINIAPMQLADLEQIKDILLEEFDDFWTFTMLKQELENKNNLTSTYFVAKARNEEQQCQVEKAESKQQEERKQILSNNKEIGNIESKEIVGFAGIVKIIDEITIMNIVVKKSKRKLGIGSALLQKIIEFSKEQKATSITLEVNYKNEPAIALYQKFGFKQVGLRKKYYHNTDDAILMTLSIL